MPETNSRFEIVAETIRQRCTSKVIGDPKSPLAIHADICHAKDAVVAEAIELAGLAPFHYARNQDGIAEPWRCYFVNQATCRTISRKMTDWFDDMKPGNKLPAMLSACGSLVLVTWLPQFDGDKEIEKQRQVNEEHLAATAAMVQNLLLLLTADGLGTYWSSGGQFRTQTMLDKLGINQSERLLAAVFVDYQPTVDSENIIIRIAGKQSTQRAAAASWAKTVVVD